MLRNDGFEVIESMKKEQTDMTDKDISELLKRNLPKAPPEPWFTRKVMARLPERKRFWAGWIETVACAVGLVVTLVFGVIYGVGLMQEPVLTVSDITITGLMAAMAGALAWNVGCAFMPRAHEV